MFLTSIPYCLGGCFLAASEPRGLTKLASLTVPTIPMPRRCSASPERLPMWSRSLACGERFTILVYGFYFSRIQTKDGQSATFIRA